MICLSHMEALLLCLSVAAAVNDKPQISAQTATENSIRSPNLHFLAMAAASREKCFLLQSTERIERLSSLTHRASPSRPGRPTIDEIRT